MNGHDDGEERSRETVREDDDPRRVEIVLPRARSIVWLGLKVYVIVVFGIALLGVAAVLVGFALVAAMR